MDAVNDTARNSHLAWAAIHKAQWLVEQVTAARIQGVARLTALLPVLQVRKILPSGLPLVS